MKEREQDALKSGNDTLIRSDAEGKQRGMQTHTHRVSKTLNPKELFTDVLKVRKLDTP